jgi:hypothetical protein
MGGGRGARLAHEMKIVSGVVKAGMSYRQTEV